MTATAAPPDAQALHNEHAEQATLGGMLLSAAVIADVAEVLAGPHDFYRPAHQIIYETILEMFGRGAPVDAVTVAADLTRAGLLTRVGGGPYLHTVLRSVPTAGNAGYYAQIVAELAISRRLAEAGTRITRLGHDAEAGEAAERIGHAQTALDSVLGVRDRGGAVALKDFLSPGLDELEAIQSRAGGSAGVLTGLAELDTMTNGLHPGQMIVVAARPAIGKSTLALGFCRYASIVQGHPSLTFSLEMSGMENFFRVMSAEAKVPLHHMRSGLMSEDEWARLARRMGDIADAPLYVDETPNLTMADIRARARRMVSRHGVRLIVIDYLQLMTSGKRVENRQQEVSDLSRSIKLLAKELEVPVVAVSQLNRGPEQRQDKTPQLSDLRDSGAIEQDADKVFLLHRADAYDRESPRAGEADVIVAKHRNGPTGTLTVAFQGHYSRFVDMAV